MIYMNNMAPKLLNPMDLKSLNQKMNIGLNLMPHFASCETQKGLPTFLNGDITPRMMKKL